MRGGVHGEVMRFSPRKCVIVACSIDVKEYISGKEQLSKTQEHEKHVEMI